LGRETRQGTKGDDREEENLMGTALPWSRKKTSNQSPAPNMNDGKSAGISEPNIEGLERIQENLEQ